MIVFGLGILFCGIAAQIKLFVLTSEVRQQTTFHMKKAMKTVIACFSFIIELLHEVL